MKSINLMIFGIGNFQNKANTEIVIDAKQLVISAV